MNAKNASKATAVNPTKKQPLSLSQDQLDEIQFPDTSSDSFVIRKRRYRIRVLNWKWEKLFRRAAMPILELELKPFERILYMVGSDMGLIQQDLGIAKSVSQSETDVDAYLTNAVVVIMMSQDKEVQDAASANKELEMDKQIAIEAKYRTLIENLDEAPDGTGVRQYLRDIARKQMDKLKLVQTLGESLMARCAEASDLTGTRSQFDSLKLAFSQRVQSFMGKAGMLAETQASFSSPSMGNGSETLPTAKPQKQPTNPPIEINTNAEATNPQDTNPDQVAEQVEDPQTVQ